MAVGALMMAAGVLLAASYEGFCFIGCVLVHPYLPYGVAVGALGLVVFAVGLFLFATSGESASYRVPPDLLPPTSDVPAVPNEPTLQPPMTRKFCPSCGNQYPLNHNVCPRDGNLLKPVR
jgi:hypothetical protein